MVRRPLAGLPRDFLLCEQTLASGCLGPGNVRQVFKQHMSERIDREQEIRLRLTLAERRCQ